MRYSLLQELKLIGEFGLRNKREVWRVKYTLAKIRKAARTLLTLEEKVLFNRRFVRQFTLRWPTREVIRPNGGKVICAHESQLDIF